MELNVEQSKLVEAEPNGIALIKGIAGSGKTTVALHRALFLHRNYCQDPTDRILLVTYNRTLVNYLMYIYEKVEEKYHEYYANIFSDNEDKVDILTIDQIIYHYFLNNIKEPDLTPLYDNEKSMKILRECVSEVKKKYSKVNVFDYNDTFLMDEIKWIKACNYLELEEYQNVDRLGRTRAHSDDTPQKLPKNSLTRRAIYDLMRYFDLRLRESGFIDPRDMAIRALEHARVNPQKPYKHIIVDEGQDLTRVQLEFLKTLYRDDKGTSFTFITDTAQSIYSQAWLVKGRSFSSVGIDISGRSNSLSKNYRTSTQISQAAYSLLEKDSEITESENYVPPSLLDQQGQHPILKSFNEERAETEFVLKEVQKLLNTNYSCADIAIIARMKRQLDCIRDSFEQAGIPSTIITTAKTSFKDNAISMLSMHAIKGLEFRVVFIIGLNNDVIPYKPSQNIAQEFQETNDRKLLYVGMTRAMELLYLSYWGSPSKFLKDINPKFLRLNPGSRVRYPSKVSVDDYIHKEKIRQTYTPEEEVRQWMIHELIETYRYPKDLIDIEYKVNVFSKMGSVDIVVNTHQAGIMAPFIMIETKAPGIEIKEGLEQLKSYMTVSPSAQYGVITNGSEFIVIDHNQEPLDDLPAFHQSMLPSGGEIYNYLDLKSKNRCTIRLDCDSPDRVVIEKDKLFKDYSGQNVIKIPVFQKVAAGSPHLMNDLAEGYFCLPSEWFVGKSDIFIVEVKGDSMKDADINDGDMVVVEKRDEAKNRDIVVVAMGDESVIKRYTPMGETVLLISENEEYEPIHIKHEQAHILGVTLGVIKGKVARS